MKKIVFFILGLFISSLAFSQSLPTGAKGFYPQFWKITGAVDSLNSFGMYDMNASSISTAYPQLVTNSQLNTRLSGFTGGGSTSSTPIGYEYNSSSWSAISPLTQVSGWSISGTKLQGTGTGGYTEALSQNHTSGADSYIHTVKFRYTSTSSADSGLKVAMISTSVASNYAFVNHASGADFGKAIVQMKYTGYFRSFKSTTALSSISVGDSLKYVFNYSAGNVTFTCYNITTGQSVSVNVVDAFTYGSGVSVSNSTAYPSIVAGNGTYQIDNWSYYIPVAKTTWLVLGNSIARGYNAGGSINRWAQILGMNIISGSGDKTSDYINNAYEVYTYFKPKYVLILVNVNDVAIGSGTYQPWYTSLYSTLTGQGITVYFLLAPPSNSQNVSGLNTWVASNWTGKTIDGYSPLWSGTGTGLNSIYDCGDGTHPNTLGHALEATTVLNSTIYQNTLPTAVKIYSPSGTIYGNGDFNAYVTKQWVENYISGGSGGGGGGALGWTASGANTYTNGNVGIGTSTFSDLLSLQGTAPGIFFNNTTSGIGTYRMGPFNSATGGFTLQKTDLTSGNTNLFISGKGSGLVYDSENIFSGLILPNIDVVASGFSNAGFLGIESWTNSYAIYAAKTGTGSLVPLVLDATNATRPNLKQIFLNTNGTLKFGYYGAGVATLDANGNLSSTSILTGTNGGTGVNNGSNTLTLGNSLIYRGGAQTTLVAGTKAVTITGTTTSSRALVTLVSQAGTYSTTVQYKGVCTANTVTITAVTTAGATDATDTSVVNVEVFN